MTPRLCLVFVVIGGGCAEPSAPPAAPRKAPELVVPPMPEAGPPAPARRAPPPEEPKPSYEEAIAGWNARLDDGPAEPEPEMTDAELAAPMKDATFIAGCGAPDEMKVTVKVAVQGGRAAGVSVYTTPADEGVARCVADHVRTLRWPTKRKLDSFTTTY